MAEKDPADLISALGKKYGKLVQVSMGDTIEEIEKLSSGSLSLDVALGGGYGKGKLVEMYGPESSGKTLLSMLALMQAQKDFPDKWTGIIDAEHAFNKDFHVGLGLNPDNFYHIDPADGETGFNVLLDMVKSNMFSLIIIDSVSAMQPKNIVEGDVGTPQMASHARLMSDAMSKLVPAAEKAGTTLILINQLREKIGVMFGCLHADMPIVFTDGRSIPIREVVEKRIEGEVWTINENTKKIESKKIIDWHFNGNVTNREDYLYIETTSIDGKGRFGVTVTPDHELLTKEGWIKAKDVNVGDSLVSKYESVFNGTLAEFLKGTFVGDCYIARTDKNTACLKLQDKKDEDYVQWKKEKLSKAFTFKRTGYKEVSNYTYELSKIKSEIGRRDPMVVFKDGSISDLSLAVWIMDDGHYQKGHKRYILSMGRFGKDREKMDQVKKLLEDNGLPSNNSSKRGTFVFTVDASKEIAARIYRYVPECMNRKIPEHLHGKYKEFNLTFDRELLTDTVSVVEKRIASLRQLRQKGKYDISVEDNHNYFSGGYRNGVVVHNSPEVTTGGNSLKFYASQRIDVRRKVGAEKDENGDPTYNDIKCKVIKNKLGPPLRTAELKFYYDRGIDNSYDVLRLGIELGLIKKAGSWFSVDDTKLGQGEEKALITLKENPDLYEDIENKIREHYGIK